MDHVKGKWKCVNGSFLYEVVYAKCSICGKQLELTVDPYYLDVIGLDVCTKCDSNMEYFFHNFKYQKISMDAENEDSY